MSIEEGTTDELGFSMNREKMFASLLARMPVAIADKVKKHYEDLMTPVDHLLMRMRCDIIDRHLDKAGTLCTIKNALPEVFKCIGNAAGAANVRLVHPAMKAMYDFYNTRLVIGGDLGNGNDTDNKDIIARRMNRLIADSPNVTEIRVIGESLMSREFLVRPLLVSLGRTLQVLNLKSNMILPDRVPSLAESLVRLTGLKTLDLGDNNIGAAGAAALAPSLLALTGLQWLSLWNNGIGAEGAAALAPSLKALTGLQWLDLNNNAVGTIGAAAIMRTLITLPGLHTITIRDNGIDLECLEFIKGMLVGVKVI